MASDDGWRDDHDMALTLHILFIEGYCQCPWMETKFARCPPVIGDVRPFSAHSVFRVWCTDSSYLDDKHAKPDAFGVERCQDEIRSGKYHAIVVVDYSEPSDTETFESSFGDLLQMFVHAGGVVAFPSSEGMLVSSMEKYFNVKWKLSDYYRTNWGPCLEENERNVYYSFGNGNLSRRVIKEYSAKGVSLRVPKHERCFGVTEKSRTQSLVPFMSGLDKAKKSDDENYDVIVAVHDYGKGSIAYFGDCNAEHQTIWLVAAFLESRSPKFPIDCFASIDENIFVEITQLKDIANEYFKVGDFDDELEAYLLALEKFGTKLGSGPQRDCYIALLSNVSLNYYKKEDYAQSEVFASKVLDIEWGQEKCSYRRALARLKMSQAKPGGNLALLRKAMSDVLNAGRTPPSTLRATQKLLSQIEAEIKKVEKKEQRQFSAGFEKALS
jgi:tetratricopeptide (TPR) repeat protein